MTETLKQIILLANLPEGQNWITLEELYAAAKLLEEDGI